MQAFTPRFPVPANHPFLEVEGKRGVQGSCLYRKVSPCHLVLFFDIAELWQSNVVAKETSKEVHRAAATLWSVKNAGNPQLSSSGWRAANYCQLHFVARKTMRKRAFKKQVVVCMHARVCVRVRVWTCVCVRARTCVYIKWTKQQSEHLLPYKKGLCAEGVSASGQEPKVINSQRNLCISSGNINSSWGSSQGQPVAGSCDRLYLFYDSHYENSIMVGNLQ